eukprot:1158892-Pelagomonas_calceolata.AAC.12
MIAAISSAGAHRPDAGFDDGCDTPVKPMGLLQERKAGVVRLLSAIRLRHHCGGKRPETERWGEAKGSHRQVSRVREKFVTGHATGAKVGRVWEKQMMAIMNIWEEDRVGYSAVSKVGRSAPFLAMST